MESFIQFLDPHLSLSLFRILHPKQSESLYSAQDHQTRIQLLCNTALFSKMRESNIPKDLFQGIEEKEEKRFNSLRSKYLKVLKAIETKKLSSIKKGFVSGNKHTKDLHFSQENFTLLFRIARGSYNRGQYEDSLRILELLLVVFEDDLTDPLEFYSAKVFSYVALVLSRGTTSLGSHLNGAKRRFRRDRTRVWEQIQHKEQSLGAFNQTLKKQVNDLKMRFFHLKIVLDYVVRKKHLLGRNAPCEHEDTPRKMSRKKSRRKSTRKMTQHTSEADNDAQDDNERKESELVELGETDWKMGKCLSVMLRSLGLANFDWEDSRMCDMLAYIFVLEVNLAEVASLWDLSKSQLFKSFQEMWFYARNSRAAESQSSIYRFLEALFVQFDFNGAGKLLKEVVKELDANWIFVNYKGEIYNRLLRVFMIVYRKVTNNVEEGFLADVLNIEEGDLKDLLGGEGIRGAELKEASQSHAEKLQIYMDKVQEIGKKLGA